MSETNGDYGARIANPRERVNGARCSTKRYSQIHSVWAPEFLYD